MVRRGAVAAFPLGEHGDFQIPPARGGVHLGRVGLELRLARRGREVVAGAGVGVEPLGHRRAGGFGDPADQLVAGDQAAELPQPLGRLRERPTRPGQAEQPPRPGRDVAVDPESISERSGRVAATDAHQISARHRDPPQRG